MKADPSQIIYLTETELLVITAFVSNRSLRATAEELGKSAKTIQAHLDHIKQKFGCKTLFQLCYIAKKLKIIL